MTKSLSEIRGEVPLIEESLDSKETAKLQQLVRVGLADKDQISKLKRALNKETTALTRQDRDLLIGTFHKLLDHVLDSQQLFQKTKQTYTSEEDADSFSESTEVSKEHGIEPGEHYDTVHNYLNTKGYKKISRTDPIYQHSMTKKKLTLLVKDGRVFKTFAESKEDKEEKHNFVFPVLVILRRKAIRLFPDGKKVGLYYSDKMKRYLSIPSTGDAIAEEIVELEDVAEPLDEAIKGKSKNKGTVGAGKPTNGKGFTPDPEGKNTSGVMSQLKGIVSNKQSAPVRFLNGSKLTVDMLTAHAILSTYNRLSEPVNQVKFDKWLNKDNPSFMKIVDFCHKHYLG